MNFQSANGADTCNKQVFGELSSKWYKTGFIPDLVRRFGISPAIEFKGTFSVQTMIQEPVSISIQYLSSIYTYYPYQVISRCHPLASADHVNTQDVAMDGVALLVGSSNADARTKIDIQNPDQVDKEMFKLGKLALKRNLQSHRPSSQWTNKIYETELAYLRDNRNRSRSLAQTTFMRLSFLYAQTALIQLFRTSTSITKAS